MLHPPGIGQKPPPGRPLSAQAGKPCRESHPRRWGRQAGGTALVHNRHKRADPSTANDADTHTLSQALRAFQGTGGGGGR
jgi:hypothetical protein